MENLENTKDTIPEGIPDNNPDNLPPLDEVKEEVKSENKEEIKSEVKDDIESENKEEIKSEVKDDIESENKDDIDLEVKEEIISEIDSEEIPFYTKVLKELGEVIYVYGDARSKLGLSATIYASAVVNCSDIYKIINENPSSFPYLKDLRVDESNDESILIELD